MTRRRSLLAATALLALLLGVGVYWALRPAWGSHLFAQNLHTQLGWSVSSAGWWPSLLHAFAFALLLGLAAAPSRPLMVGSSLLWLLVELAFELGQHGALSPWLGALPGALGRYFTAGTFDPLDLLAVVVGVALALRLVWTVERRRA